MAKFKSRYTPEELRERARAFFDECDRTVIGTNDKTGVVITKPKLLSSLCRHLWVTNDYIYDNSKRKGYELVIEDIKRETEESMAEWILTGAYNAQAGIFVLKAKAKWKEKEEEQEADRTINIKFI